MNTYGKKAPPPARGATAIVLAIVACGFGCSSESMGLGPMPPDAGTPGEDAAGSVDAGSDVTVQPDTNVAPDASGDAVDDRVVGADANDALSEAGGTCASRCASGVCEANGDCKRCVNDDECTGGRVCGSGVCAPRCGTGRSACAAPFACCNEHCVDTTIAPQHCGACGMACSGTQFCSNVVAPSACKSDTLANVCASKKATFLLDGLQADQEASAVVQAAILARCAPPPVAMTSSQSVSGAINTTTGRPIAGGGELLVAVGGDSAQRLVNYLEDSGLSRVYNEYDGLNTTWFKRRDANSSVVATITMSTLSATHDYFLVELVFDRASGTLALVLYGLDVPGTRAATFHFANTMLPSIATFSQNWYLYEWSGTSAGGPSAADTFTLLASGM